MLLVLPVKKWNGPRTQSGRIVKEAIEQNPLALRFMNEGFEKDREIALDVIQFNKGKFRQVGYSYKYRARDITTVLKQSPRNVGNAIDKNPDILHKHLFLFEHVDDDKKRDPDFVARAAIEHSKVMKYITDKNTASC